MKHTIKNIKYLVCCLTIALLFACQQPGKNVTGSEYMPDMGHSIAYEGNYYSYYYWHMWGGEEQYYKYAKPRLPVKGTIPRSIGTNNEGMTPYYYGNTDEERERAIKEIVNNPLHITANNIKVGKELYIIYCGICHGDKADGDGYLVREDGGKYPVQPANLLLPDFVNASNGRFYHTIMQGRNLMASYKDKLNYKERWQVIQYIRSLQAESVKLVYNEKVNTFNGDIPEAAIVAPLVTPTVVNHPVDLGHQMNGEHKEAKH